MSILSSRKIFDLINGKFAHIRLLLLTRGIICQSICICCGDVLLVIFKEIVRNWFLPFKFFFKPLTLGKTYLIQRQDNSVDNCHRGSEAVKLEQSPAVPVLYPILFVLSPFFQSLNVWVFFFMQGYHAFTIKNSAGIKELKVFE